MPDALGNLKRRLDNDKRIQEEICAAYIEAQTRVGIAKFDLGLRYEKTKTAARIADIHPVSEVAAAGYPVNAAGTAPTTVEGLLYQYNNGTYSPWRIRRLVPQRRGEVRFHRQARRPARLQRLDPTPGLR